MPLGRASIIIHRHAVDRYISRCGADPSRARYDLIRLANRATPTRERTPAGDAYWLCEPCENDLRAPTAPVLIVKRDGHFWHVVSVLGREEWETQRTASLPPEARALAEAASLGIDLAALEPQPDAYGFKAGTPLADRVTSLKARCTRLARTNTELATKLAELIPGYIRGPETEHGDPQGESHESHESREDENVNLSLLDS